MVITLKTKERKNVTRRILTFRAWQTVINNVFFNKEREKSLFWNRFLSTFPFLAYAVCA